MNGLFYLQVNAGLCNRLRALISGICYARKLGRKLIVIWPKHKPECAAGFYDLFTTDSLPEDIVVVEGELSQKVTCLSSTDMEKLIYSVNFGDTIAVESHGHFWPGLHETWVEYLQMLKPSDAVLSRLEDYQKKGTKILDIAIHIRRTDNEKAIRLSPLASFIEKIKEYPSPQRFILFSDDTQALQILRSEFGAAKFVCPETIRERYSKEGMIEACAVFFSLASVKTILGSANSSFSEIASQYGKNELILVRA